MKRVAFICNMNNNFFTMARYMRDYGYNADIFILNNEFKHFHPLADSFDTDFKSYTKILEWGHFSNFVNFDRHSVLEPLEGYDVLVGCGKAPAFLNRAGRDLDILIPYGSEIGLTRYRSGAYNSSPVYTRQYLLTEMNFWRFTRHQAAGMVAAKYFLDQYDRSFRQVGGHNIFTYRVPPWVYTPAFNPESMERRLREASNRSMMRTPVDVMKSLRGSHHPIIFHHSRHVWKNCSDGISWKANDKLIRGFAEFVKRAGPSVSPCLVTCEYGEDVAESKTLIAELGIERHVHWMPLMLRKEVMLCLALADFGSSEFHESWLHCGTIHETLAAARPLFHYRQDALYSGRHTALYPIIQVEQPLDVTDALMRYLDEPEYFRDLGEKGRQWFQREMAEGAMHAFVSMVEGRFEGDRPVLEVT